MNGVGNSAEQELVCSGSWACFGINSTVRVPGGNPATSWPVFTWHRQHDSIPVLQQPLLFPQSRVYSPKPTAIGTLAVIIGEYGKISHFYLKEITYYK